MALLEVLSQRFWKAISEWGVSALLIVVIILLLSYFNAIKLDNIPIPGLTIGLWAYLLINIGVATPFRYIREKNIKTSPCPQCSKPLKIKPIFYCEKCGEIVFKEMEK